MDIPTWKAGLGDDREIIHGLLTEMDKVGIEKDAKLLHLIDLINQKMAIPLNPGNLKVRVENWMHTVDLTGTGEDNVLTAKSSDVAYHKD